MNVETIASWTRVLEQLAAEDEARAAAAAERCRACERELAQAQEHEALMARMAQASRGALVKTSGWLERLRHEAGAGAVPTDGTASGEVVSSASELVASFSSVTEK